MSFVSHSGGAWQCPSLSTFSLFCLPDLHLRKVPFFALSLLFGMRCQPLVLFYLAEVGKYESPVTWTQWNGRWELGPVHIEGLWLGCRSFTLWEPQDPHLQNTAVGLVRRPAGVKGCRLGSLSESQQSFPACVPRHPALPGLPAGLGAGCHSRFLSSPVLCKWHHLSIRAEQVGKC